MSCKCGTGCILSVFPINQVALGHGSITDSAAETWGCKLKTPMEISVELHKIFRKPNGRDKMGKKIATKQAEI